ncbi:MAG: repressor LexA [Deltaproteobacteria bacterium]|nr:repressor LexA [Deltaproteobacteria bacterium]MBZ0219865.1 transcriptional repressor LexA [Deltaproteobacteria bacterium]
MGSQLTSRQKEILDFLSEFIGEAGYPPSLRDICARFGIRGPKNAAKHLAALERKGFLKREASASRAISLLGPDRTRRGGISLPIAGRVRAGAPEEAVEDILGHVVHDEHFFKCRDAFLLRVEGESMIEAGISEGDLVVVRPQPDASDGDIIVALVDGEATVKRLVKTGGTVVLKPENPAMEPIVVKEGSDFAVIGKVISVIRLLEK